MVLSPKVKIKQEQYILDIPLVYAKVNECYFGEEKLTMFLIFLEHKEIFKTYIADAILFPYSFVAVKYFH